MTNPNETPSSTITIYTDGACKGNPGIGGWGALISNDKKKLEIAGFSLMTTNNEMELMAVLRSLKRIKGEGKDIHLYSDSKYVIQGITEWLPNWKTKGWRNASKKPIANAELWREIDQLNQRHNISWFWVEGHSGVEGNEKADALANEAITFKTSIKRATQLEAT